MKPESRPSAALLLALLAALTGCAGGRPAPVAPAPKPARASSTGPASAAAGATPAPASLATSSKPTAPVTAVTADTGLSAADTAAAQASVDDSAATADSGATADEADSAADAAALEQLANASPGDPVDGVGGPAPAGGAKAIPAVTWDIDVNSFSNHERVQFYLDFFQGPARDRMAIWLDRMPKYEPMIRAAFAHEGLPGDLEYLALIESGFSNSATSRARAVGMWQFMKGTGRMYGLRIDRWVDERRDPVKATPAAARYLRDLRDRFGSLYLAAAAYNAGGGRVSRGISRLEDADGVDDESASDSTFFRLYDTRYLRRETRDYVPKLIAAALIAKEPERYGFTPAPAVAPFTYDSLIVPDATGLDVIARLADTTIQAIRELNPEYLRMATPPHTSSVVRIPPGTGAKVAESYADLPASKRLTFREHFVARGETLGHIARVYHVTLEDIRIANPRIDPRRLRLGSRLVIPVSGVAFDPRAAALAEESDAPRRWHAAPGGSHRVGSGESWWTLSRRYGVTIAELRKWNGASPTAGLRIGQWVKVSAGGRGRPRVRHSAPSTAVASATTHKVRYGETLSALAERYGVSISALRRFNALAPDEALRSGTVLRIPRG
ncbi:MAG TPA: LysM peptidoglycan-binding domain-containing protein [Gemmatimonadales bacterium]|nr:LysM peptidoglycan-binding domain-containing protein [Gemmatimonadales bacterium]